MVKMVVKRFETTSSCQWKYRGEWIRKDPLLHREYTRRSQYISKMLIYQGSLRRGEYDSTRK